MKEYLDEPNDGSFTRERNFADALRNLADKYQVEKVLRKLLFQNI